MGSFLLYIVIINISAKVLCCGLLINWHSNPQVQNIRHVASELESVRFSEAEDKQQLMWLICGVLLKLYGECTLLITAAPFGHHSSLAQLQPGVEGHETGGRANVTGKQVLTGSVSESLAEAVRTFLCWQSHDPGCPSGGQRCAVSQRMLP
ncbi:uncharacterized [Tachysurus ichikawai]